MTLAKHDPQPRAHCTMQLSILGKSTPISWSAVIPITAIGYLTLVRLLRWRRYNARHKKWAGRKLDSITPEEAQTILHGITMWDMPGLFGGLKSVRSTERSLYLPVEILVVYALSFALFKTYAIVSPIRIHTNVPECLSINEHH